ncbi:MAG: Fic family protein [Rhodobacteraceae bacterium]|nr:Fic family protein [Paracoccaceae bacterium]
MTERPIWNMATGITDIKPDRAEPGGSEIPGIRAVWAEQRARLKGSPQLAEFTERLSREWAIETSVIENLYEIERGVTQTLIEKGFQADLISHGTTNKPRGYVLQLLRDQKDALDGVFDFVKGGRSLSVSYIRELHAALLRSQHTTEGVDAQGQHIKIPLIKGAWKKQPNHPVREGIAYKYCPPEHVQSEVERLITLHGQHVADDVPDDVQAAWLHHRFTRIHPFQDGNGRVARAIVTLVLVKQGLFPLVVTRDDKPEYIDALEAADGGDLKPLIALITRLQMAQFRKASAISESVLAREPESAVADHVQTALDDLRKAAGKAAADKREEFEKVFDYAAAIEQDIKDRLNAITPELEGAVQQILDNAAVQVNRSDAETGHYFRAQIVDTAKNHLGYFANTRAYRAWVALNLKWSRRAKLVFAIHGIGRPFNGSLICAPSLEFKDLDEDGAPHTARVPLAEDGFVFFYTEAEDRILACFRPWREHVLTTALREVTQNL